jgi:hypothetical protein
MWHTEYCVRLEVFTTVFLSTWGLLGYDTVLLDWYFLPSFSRVKPINFWRCRHCILSKEQKTPVTQCDVYKELNSQYYFISGICLSYSIKIRIKECFRNQICFRPQMKRWVGTYSLESCQGELMSVIHLTN